MAQWLESYDFFRWVNPQSISVILFSIGLLGAIIKKNILKTIISIAIMDASVILFFLSLNYDRRAVPPVELQSGDVIVADPLTQAVMITAIVIGISSIAVSLTMFIHLYNRYGTADWDKSKAKRTEIL